MHTFFFQLLLITWGLFCIAHLQGLLFWPTNFIVVAVLSILTVIWARCTPALESPKSPRFP